MRWLVPLALLVVSACSDSNPQRDCDEAGAHQSGVFAIDARTQQPVCGIGTGLYSDRYTALTPRGPAPTSCDGLHEFARIDPEDRGTFRLEVHADGYQTASTTIRIFTDSCGEQAVSPSGPRNGLPGVTGYVTVALEPE
ncbi:MAG: hypothetical protein R3B89_24960 [Polyangiaceae bacterium]